MNSPSRNNVCPCCGQRLRNKAHLIAQLSELTGVEPDVMQTMSMPALEGIIEAWLRPQAVNVEVVGAPRRLRAAHRLLPAKDMK
jgi:hypothetical protein